MTKLTKISLITALMATGAMAGQKVLPDKTFCYDGININKSILLQGNVYNGGLITKVDGVDDKVGIASYGGTDKTIYNMHSVQEDKNGLSNETIADPNITLGERVTELAGNCVICGEDADCTNSGKYTPEDVYTITGMGSVDTESVSLSGTQVVEFNLWESLNAIAQNTDDGSEIYGNHRVFNMVSKAPNQTYISYTNSRAVDASGKAAATAGDVFVSIPTAADQNAVNLEITYAVFMDPFRTFDQTLILDGAQLHNYSAKPITMHAKIVAKDNGSEANSISIVGRAPDVQSANSQITFANEVDLSKATNVTFSDCKTIFKKKLTI